MKEITYEISAKKDTRVYTAIYAVMSILVALTMGMTSGALKGMVFQFLIFSDAIVLVWLFVRFYLTMYIYGVTYSEKGWMFFAKIMQGKRTLVLCRMPIEQLCGVDYLAYKAHKKKYRKSPLSYSYMFHLRPSHVCRLSFMEEGEKTDILIEANEAFASALQNALATLDEDSTLM